MGVMKGATMQKARPRRMVKVWSGICRAADQQCQQAGPAEADCLPYTVAQ